jgi:hypothetical protein
MTDPITQRQSCPTLVEFRFNPFSLILYILQHHPLSSVKRFSSLTIGLTAASAAPYLYIPLFEPFTDHPRGAANPGVDPDRCGRAVQRAGAAFHAGVPIRHPDPFPVCFKNLVWTDLQASAATDAEHLIQFQGRYPLKIPESFHLETSVI